MPQGPATAALSAVVATIGVLLAWPNVPDWGNSTAVEVELYYYEYYKYEYYTTVIPTEVQTQAFGPEDPPAWSVPACVALFVVILARLFC